MKISNACLPIVVQVLVATTASAHHSFAVFDQTKTVEIRGVVVDFKFRNPHSSFVMDGLVFVDGVLQSNGIERWEIESDTTAALATKGIGADSFKPGDRIAMRAAPSREQGFKFAHATSLTTADGTELRFGFGGSNRIFSPSLRQAFGAPSTSAGVTSAPASAPPGAIGVRRIAGRWQQPRTPSGAESALPLNERGLAARAAYDPKLSPANTCEPMSFPDVFNAPFFLIDIAMTDADAVIRNEVYDIVRRVPLTGAPAAADPDGWFGTTSGRIEGETLVVESRGYPASKWGLGIATHVLGGGADVPSSAEKTLTERYSVTSDGQTLILEYTVDDPAYLREAYESRLELTRVPDGTEMYPYECDPEAAAMWSRTAGDDPLEVPDR